MSKIITYITTLMLLILLSTANVFAGLVMEQEIYLKGSGQKSKGKIYMQNNKVKYNDNDGSYAAIFDLNTGEMIQIDNVHKKYTSAKAKDYFTYSNELARRMKQARKQQLDGINRKLYELSPEQRAQTEKMMREQGFYLQDGEPRTPNVTFKKVDSNKKIAGFSSVKYEIYRDGKLNEEIWTSKEVGFDKEIDMSKMTGYLNEQRKIEESFSDSIVISEDEENAYIEIFNSGYPVKTVSHRESGSALIEEITKVSYKDIDENEFKIPAGYQKITLEQMAQLTAGN